MHWQATIVTAVVLAVALPIGAIAGSWLFRPYLALGLALMIVYAVSIGGYLTFLVYAYRAAEGRARDRQVPDMRGSPPDSALKLPFQPLRRGQ